MQFLGQFVIVTTVSFPAIDGASLKSAHDLASVLFLSNVAYFCVAIV